MPKSNEVLDLRRDTIDFHHQNMLCSVLQWNYKHNLITLLALASCNIDQDHPDFDSKTLLATQNMMGLALTTIITLGNNGSSEDLFKSFCKMLTEFLYTDPKIFSARDELCIKTFVMWQHFIYIFHIAFYLYLWELRWKALE